MNAHRASNNGSNATSRLHNAIRGESEEVSCICKFNCYCLCYYLFY